MPHAFLAHLASLPPLQAATGTTPASDASIVGSATDAQLAATGPLEAALLFGLAAALVVAGIGIVLAGRRDDIIER